MLYSLEWLLAGVTSSQLISSISPTAICHFTYCSVKRAGHHKRATFLASHVSVKPYAIRAVSLPCRKMAHAEGGENALFSTGQSTRRIDRRLYTVSRHKPRFEHICALSIASCRAA